MPNDQADEIARRLLLLSALAGRVAEARDKLKDDLQAMLSPGTLLRPQLDDASVGSVSYTVGRGRAEVYDPKLFLAWVREHHPEHVRLEPVVDETFRADCVVVSERAGVPLSPYGDLDVAGIRAAKGSPTISVRPDKKRTDELWAAIRDATLTELEPT